MQMSGRVHLKIDSMRRANLRQYIDTNYKAVAENNDPESEFLFGNLPDKIELIDKQNKMGTALLTGQMPEKKDNSSSDNKSSNQGNGYSSSKTPLRRDQGSSGQSSGYTYGSRYNQSNQQQYNQSSQQNQSGQQYSQYNQQSKQQKNTNYQNQSYRGRNTNSNFRGNQQKKK